MTLLHLYGLLPCAIHLTIGEGRVKIDWITETRWFTTDQKVNTISRFACEQKWVDNVTIL